MVAMTLLGCDCDAKVCEFISETPAQWSSVGDCERAAKARVVRNSNLNYPLISGLCRVVGEQPQLVAAPPVAEPAKTVADDGASRGVYASLTNGSHLIFRKTASGYSAMSSGVGQATDGAIGWLRRSAELVASAY